MAWYVGGGGTSMSRSSSAPMALDDADHCRRRAEPQWVEDGKRGISSSEAFDSDDNYTDFPQSKRFRPFDEFGFQGQGHVVRNANLPPFYILREDSISPTPFGHGSKRLHEETREPSVNSSQKGSYEPVANRNVSSIGTSTPMERTSSGLSISSDGYNGLYLEDENLMTDKDAADRVVAYVTENRRRNRNSKHERILRSLIRPKSVEFDIDNDALRSIWYAANEIFFYGSLKTRVTWVWSDDSSARFRSNIIGTTALRKKADGGGYETRIILSSYFLRDKRYNRRLLISTFLHELIHSYLFICCGFSARSSGGHTDGFKRIARLIDDWAGPDNLYLNNIEADLQDFLADTDKHDGHNVRPDNSCYYDNDFEKTWPVERPASVHSAPIYPHYQDMEHIPMSIRYK